MSRDKRLEAFLVTASDETGSSMYHELLFLHGYSLIGKAQVLVSDGIYLSLGTAKAIIKGGLNRGQQGGGR